MSIQTGTKLRRFIRTILARPGLGAHVRTLDVAVEAEGASVPFYSGAERDRFWGALGRVGRVGVAFHTDFLRSLIDYQVEEEEGTGEVGGEGVRPAPLGALKELVFTELQLPPTGKQLGHPTHNLVRTDLLSWFVGVVCPRVLSKLYRTAPNVTHFVLGLNEDENVEDLPTDDPPFDGRPWPLERLEISGPLSQLPNACVALCNIHGSLTHLGLSEDTEDGNIGSVLARIDHSRLKTLELNAYTVEDIELNFSEGYDGLDELRLDYHSRPETLSRLPPNLARLRLGPDNRPSLPGLRALLSPGPHLLPNLTHLRVEHDPPSLGHYARARPSAPPPPALPRFAADPSGHPIIQPSPHWARPTFSSEWAFEAFREVVGLAERRGVRLRGAFWRAWRVEEGYLAEVEWCGEMAGREGRGELEWERVEEGEVSEGDWSWGSVEGGSSEGSEESGTSEEETESTESGSDSDGDEDDDDGSEDQDDDEDEDEGRVRLGPVALVTIDTSSDSGDGL